MFDQNGKIIYDSVLENEYLDQAIHEGLRLHPLAIIMNRECTEPIQLEGTKGKMIQFKKGDSINIPVYSIHRDPGKVGSHTLLATIFMLLFQNFTLNLKNFNPNDLILKMVA